MKYVDRDAAELKLEENAIQKTVWKKLYLIVCALNKKNIPVNVNITETLLFNLDGTSEENAISQKKILKLFGITFFKNEVTLVSDTLQKRYCPVKRRYFSITRGYRACRSC